MTLRPLSVGRYYQLSSMILISNHNSSRQPISIITNPNLSKVSLTANKSRSKSTKLKQLYQVNLLNSQHHYNRKSAVAIKRIPHYLMQLFYCLMRSSKIMQPLWTKVLWTLQMNLNNIQWWRMTMVSIVVVASNNNKKKLFIIPDNTKWRSR